MKDIEQDAYEIEEMVTYGASYSDIIDWLQNRDAGQKAASPGNGWVKCSERLPTEAEADINGDVWVFWNLRCTETRHWTVFKSDTDMSNCYWMPTGLKRPQPPVNGGPDSE